MLELLKTQNKTDQVGHKNELPVASLSNVF